MSLFKRQKENINYAVNQNIGGIHVEINQRDQKAKSIVMKVNAMNPVKDDMTIDEKYAVLVKVSEDIPKFIMGNGDW